MRGLDVIRGYIEKIEASVVIGASDGADAFKASLAPDMLPLGRQLQMACDNAKNGAARLTGLQAPIFSDDESTAVGFMSRIERTQAWLRTLTPNDFDGSEQRLIDQKFRRAAYSMTGGDYLRAVLLPNFYFHITTMHGILRVLGLGVGKDDYLGELPRSTADVVSPDVDRGAQNIAFLTPDEAMHWLALQQIVENTRDNVSSGGSHFSFAPQPVDVNLLGLFGALLDDVGPFAGALLRLTDWIWDDEYDVDPLSSFREETGEKRPLNEVPAILLGAGAVMQAAALLGLVVERRWTATFYLQSKAATLCLREGDQVDVYSSDIGVEKRIQYRLIELGIPVSLL